MNDKTDKARVRWATLAKRITERLLLRHEKHEDLCQSHATPTPDDKRQALKQICALNREISRLADDLGTVEAEAGLGTLALFGQDHGNLLRIVVALLATARFDRSVGRDARCVEDVLSLVGARDPEDCLAVRALFRDDSMLKRHINLSSGVSLDDCGVKIKESSLNRLLGQNPDDSECMTDAVALTTARWK